MEGFIAREMDCLKQQTDVTVCRLMAKIGDQSTADVSVGVDIFVL